VQASLTRLNTRLNIDVPGNSLRLFSNLVKGPTDNLKAHTPESEKQSMVSMTCDVSASQQRAKWARKHMRIPDRMDSLYLRLPVRAFDRSLSSGGLSRRRGLHCSRGIWLHCPFAFLRIDRTSMWTEYTNGRKARKDGCDVCSLARPCGRSLQQDRNLTIGDRDVFKQRCVEYTSVYVHAFVYAALLPTERSFPFASRGSIHVSIRDGSW